MPSEIRAEHTGPTALTITLASLASSATAGRQSTLVSNTDNAQLLHIYYLITTAASADANTNIRFFLIKGDGTIRTDNAGATDAAFTPVTAEQVHAVVLAAGAAAYRGSFKIYNPGIEWGIAVVQDSTDALDSTGGNHSITYVIENPESQ